MLHVMSPLARSETQYHNAVVKVLRSLIGDHGQIRGYNLHSEPDTFPADLSVVIGGKSLLKFFSAVNAAFPDYELSVDNLVTKGEKVMIKYSIHGIQKGKFMGAASTGCRVRVTGLDIFRLNSGRVVEYWIVNHLVEQVV